MSVDPLVERGLLQRDVPLGPFTTYKSGGPAKLFAEIPDLASLKDLIASGVTAAEPLLVLGRGSNLVVADLGFDGLVIRLGKSFAGMSFDKTTVLAGGIAPLPRLARASVDHGIGGLEFLVGIPGSVGGAVRQNAGCFGVETRDRLREAHIIDLLTGDERASTADQLEMSYRHSNVSSADLVVEALFEGWAGEETESKEKLREITRWRRDHQPGGTLNAGSVFKNPPHISAGELIDKLGLKGLCVGGVCVSEKHANFFVAGPEATSADIRRLVAEVKNRVLAETGTNLETEIQFVGFEE
jgi:UDP-N-acetylmuramate dehydrogenase